MSTGRDHDIAVSVTIEDGSAADHSQVRDLLSAASLPADGVPDDLDLLVLARAGGAVVGAAGVELFGSSALVRSVVVATSHRGSGLGTRLVSTAIGGAADAGAREVVLLTTDAAAYFGRLGFEEIDRAAVSKAVRESREFSVLCPATAVCMRKTIGGRN